VIEGCLGDTDPSRVGTGFQASRDVHPITVDPVLFLDHISQVDPNAESHLSVFRKISVSRLEFLLDGYPTLNSIHHTGELRQEVVARGIKHSTPMLLDQGEHHLLVSL